MAQLVFLQTTFTAVNERANIARKSFLPTVDFLMLLQVVSSLKFRFTDFADVRPEFGVHLHMGF